MSWKGYLIAETLDKMPRKIHIGRCPTDNKIWVFERDESWYEPTEEMKSKIEKGEFNQVFVLKSKPNNINKGKVNKRRRK